MLYRKRTETAQLDPVAARQRRDDLIEIAFTMFSTSADRDAGCARRYAERVRI